jgi:hypothetical protein
MCQCETGNGSCQNAMLCQFQNRCSFQHPARPTPSKPSVLCGKLAIVPQGFGNCSPRKDVTRSIPDSKPHLQKVTWIPVDLAISAFPTLAAKIIESVDSFGDDTSVHLSVQYARISIQEVYTYRYGCQCTIICTALSHRMFQCFPALDRVDAEKDPVAA